MLKTILNNLIANAIKYTSRGGKIIIESKQSDYETIIAVTDNGIGIKPEKPL